MIPQRTKSIIRHGVPPYLECSSKGDKRFSAFYARLRAAEGQSIETVYQAAKRFTDGSTGLSVKLAKGRVPENIDEVNALYADLWNQYIAENPHLIDVLKSASGLSDIFGQPGHVCQASELWRIRSILLD